MAPDELDRRVRENLARVRERIAATCDAAGRSVDEVRLVGVSKYVGIKETRALVEEGCPFLGEARPQQLWEKAAAPEFSDCKLLWHLIGHLQRNKVARTVSAGCIIESVDSERLMLAIDAAAANVAWKQVVLLEVNTSGEPEKHGFRPDQLASAVELARSLENTRVHGLMTMASRTGGQATARRNFATLRGLQESLTPNVPEGHTLETLSMGMSGDLEAAIHEGSTSVRVGSALWEGIK